MRFHESWDIIHAGGQCGKPIVEDAVVLGCDGTGAWIEDQWYGAGMKGAETKVDVSFGSR